MAVLDISNIVGNVKAVIVDEDPNIVTIEEAQAGDLVFYQSGENAPAILFAVSQFGPMKIFTQLVVRNNYTASTNPTTDDDLTKGYNRGSEWMYQSRMYKCVDASIGAAKWVLIGQDDDDTIG